MVDSDRKKTFPYKRKETAYAVSKVQLHILFLGFPMFRRIISPSGSYHQGAGDKAKDASNAETDDSD